MKKSFESIVIIIFVCITAPQVFAQLSGKYQDGLKYIDKEDLRKNITYLASDDMKGRAAGTPENLEAAKYIARKFYDFGLIPYNDIANPPLYKAQKQSLSASKVFTPEKFLQRFNLVESKLNQAESNLTLFKGSIKKYNYNYQKDYLIDYSANKNVTINSSLLFLGYGIEKHENCYTDYLTEEGQILDVKNKIVLIVENAPQESDTSSSFNKSKSLGVKSVKAKVKALQEKGALAVLVVQSTLKNQSQFAIKTEALSRVFSRTETDIPELNREASIPIVYISKDVLMDIFSNSDKNINEILKDIDKDLKPRSFEFVNTTLELKTSFDNKLIETQNVIGFLEGTDPVLKNEYVVVGGHYDHVGMGYFGAMDKANAGKIHNGADDNASGTAGVIELAEAFSKVKPKRSIIFIGFTAEEYGMLGAKYYAYQNPLYPLAKTVGMVNLDMISRNDNRMIWIGGVYYSSDMKLLVEEANKEIGFELFYNVGLYTFASDQGPFIRRNVPSIFFFAGDHEDYHTPSDDIDKVDFEKAEKVSKLAFLSTWLLANQENKPAYRVLSMEEKTNLVKESSERYKKYQTNKSKEDETIQ